MDILIIILVILFILSIPFLIIDDLILFVWYFLMPGVIRNKCIRVFKKSEQKITILGTLHGMHLTNKKIKKYYNFLDIEAVVRNVKPDLVLVESLQKEIDLGNIGDGPPEMLFVHLIAKELNIPVKGIDWYSLEDNPGTTNNKRDQIMLQNIMDNIQDYKNVLVVVGASHLLVEKKKIKKYNFKSIHLAKNEINKIFFHNKEKLTFPKEMLKYIDIRIEREKERLNTVQMDEKWKQAIKRVISGLTKFKEFIND